MRAVLHHMVLSSFVGMVMRDVVLHCDEGSVRGVGNSHDAEAEAQGYYS